MIRSAAQLSPPAVQRVLTCVSLPLFSDQEQQAEEQECAAGEAKLVSLEQRLLAFDGPPRPRPFWDPLKELIYVLISARTRTETSLAVLATLEARYRAESGDWRGLRDAPLPDVLALLAPVTFSENKAPALQAALGRITRQNRGVLSLDFFQKQPVERIRRWLETFEGVGPRGSAAVANHSSLRLRALAIDTHHHRIARRLGFTSKTATPAQTEDVLLRLMPEDRWPPGRLTAAHDLLKRHGQLRCTGIDWQPHCPACPLLSRCPTGAQVIRTEQPAPERFLQNSARH